MRLSLKLALSSLLFLCAVAVVAGLAAADTHTWDGGGGDNLAGRFHWKYEICLSWWAVCQDWRDTDILYDETENCG